MFYSKDILTSKRRDGFAVIWLAATLGAKHSFKKASNADLPPIHLSKREVNQVNVVNACEELTSPKEPMALRLTSSLMVGVTRVYSEQYSFFYGEVNQVFQKVKRAWTEAKTADLDMPVTEARAEAITIDLDLHADLPVERPLNLEFEREKNLDFGWILQTPGQSTNSSSILSHSPSAFATTSFGAPSLEADSHVGSLKSITLDQSKSQAQHSRPFGMEGTTGMILDGPFDDLLFGPLDENQMPSQVLDDGQFDLFADLREDNEEVKRRRRERKGEDFHIDDIDFSAIMPAHEPDLYDGQSYNVGENVGELAPEGVEIQPMEDIVQPLVVPTDGQEAATARRQKRKRVLIDAATQITGAEFTAMRNEASANLVMAGRQAAIKERARKDKVILDSIMDVPALDFGPILKSFYKEKSLKRAAPATARADPTQRKKGKPADAAAFDGEQGLQPFEFVDMASTGDTGLNQSVGGFDGGYMEFPRGATVDGSVDDPETLRAGEERRKSELMPWHKTSRAGSVASDQSSRPGSARKRRNSVSALGDDFALDPMRRPSSVYGDQPDFGDLEDRGFGDDSFFGAVGEPVSSDERELNHFLNYVKEISISANSNIVHFQDLLPIDATSRVAASRAFYHILSLGTRDMIIPTQTAPYQDIRIQIK
ncbi:Rec8 like protein-domain-containing protein [Geranomyces variabilis]|nr:Rec8 like protein-domain-containing protein [Geranomyces variabilis]KAJ3131555.1 hypothetical protein HDU90_008222 [Geranomyces variabilis]